MFRGNKVKQVQPSLQPWNHQQQNHNSINTAELIHSSFNPETMVQSIQPINSPEQRGSPAFYRFNKSISRNNFSKQQSRNGSENKKYTGVDYVKKNQQNLKFYHCMSQNYSSLLNDDLESFMPLNPNCAFNQYLKRPSINTTYIGYYEEKPFFVQSPCKPRSKKQTRKTRSIESRPRTSDAKLVYESENRRCEQQQERQSDNHLYDRTTLSVGGYHLQKMLKIKEKLRQKLKRNSEKKDIQRGLYVKSSMKIEDQRSGEHKNSFSHKRSPTQSRKSSSKIIENNQKQKIRVDKWKQYMKLKNESSKPPVSSQKTNKFFAVLGGSIYK